MTAQRDMKLWSTLPHDAQAQLNLTWAEIEPFLTELKSRELNPQTVEAWLLDWSKVNDLLLEIGKRLSVAKDLDTTDRAAEEKYLTFEETVGIPSEREDQVLREKLLKSGLKPKNFDLPLARMKLDAEIFREENLPLSLQDDEISIEYSRIVGTQSVTWNGVETTVTELEQEFLNPNRDSREKAWRTVAARQLQDVAAINGIWARLFELRTSIATNAHCPSYREYQWKSLGRMAYSPEDCQKFTAAILEVAVPVATKIYNERRDSLGLKTLRPWDVMDGWYSRPVDPSHINPLKPFRSGNDLASSAQEIFAKLDPELGQHFKTMIREELLDLENRKGKTPGAYCTSFDVVRRPFILMNAVGTHEDVQTMLHEAGHAFHEFEYGHLPHPGQRNVPTEFAEVASMGMELLAGNFLGKEFGGFYSASDAARARLEHLERTILFWPFMAVVDSFQQWAYTNPKEGKDGATCTKKWDTLWQQFIPGIDYSGFEEFRATGWHRKQHIFTAPFYYVEYGLAQLGALQIWKRSLTDLPGALKSYREALTLGATAPLPELFRRAGAKLAFDAETLGDVVRFTAKQIDLLRSGDTPKEA